jgi:uncharacterized membrane protein YccC
MHARVIPWLQQHDRGYAALRRAARAAIALPTLLALSVDVVHNASIALFSAFGSFALLLLVDFTGRMRARLEAQAALSVAGAALICLGTLASRTIWSSVLLMAVIGFLVIFVGVVSSVLAGATTALLLAFILAVATRGPLSALPDRLAGWGMAAGTAFLAVWLLWPSPARSPLRASTAAACRALAEQIARGLDDSERDRASLDAPRALPNALESVTSLQQLFLATPWRPTGLGASDRAIVRLVDEISWTSAIVAEIGDEPRPAYEIFLSVQRASAALLRESATLLESRSAPTGPLADARSALSLAINEMERHLRQPLPEPGSASGGAPFPSDNSPIERFLSMVEFSFRCRELGYAAERIAHDVERSVTADRRKFFDRVLGHEDLGLSPWDSARARITSHLHRHSVWLHNSVRGAVGLALAVLIAEEIGIDHSFWVIFGTLSVLRSNALNTGQNALRAVGGTLIGFVLGAGVVEVVGTNVTLLWFLLPVVLLVAGFAPTAISFAAGQAGFTLTLVILFNILEPAGWRVGLLRLEDVAIGTAVSAGVALLFWPRGAAGELGAAMHDAYTTSVGLLATATTGHARLLSSAPHSPDDSEPAARASRRLDDAFRTYLVERGAKPVPLSDVATLITGVAILRLSAEAVAKLGDHRLDADGEWAVARQRVAGMASSIVQWYDEFSDVFQGDASTTLAPQGTGDDEVVDAVRDQLMKTEDPDLDEAVGIVWTADQLVAIQRLESRMVIASNAAAALWTSPRSSVRLTN